MGAEPTDGRGFFEAVAGDGRGLLILVGVSLAFAGGFAMFLSAAGLLLPQDVAYLGMTAEELCRLHGCRVVDFMIHDRVAFGGALLAIGALYVWLAEFPLRAGAAWAWWLLLVSGVLGFATFLLYLGYGYLDTWHGSGTLALVPFYVVGMVRSWPLLAPPRAASDALGRARRLRQTSNWGTWLLLAASTGLALAGLVIMVVGVTDVFVPQDLGFMGVSAAELDTINPRLVPLMAHDRAGFGGAIFITGLLVTGCVALADRSRSLWQVLCVVAVVGFGAAIGIHGVVGYTDSTHVGPAVLGAVVFGAGLVGTATSSRRHAR
jgi:hypothetical protein